MAKRSASRTIGAFERPASSTSRTIPAKVLSAARRVASMSKASPTFTGPLITKAPAGW